VSSCAKQSERWSKSYRLWALVLAAVACAAAAALLIPVQAQQEQPRQERPLPTTIKGAEVTPQAKATEITKKLTDLPKPKAWAPGQPIKEIPRRNWGRVPTVPKIEPKRDPLLAFQIRAAVANLAPDPLGAPIVNIDGQGFSGVNPPDPVGDVGGKYYIQAINSANGTLYTVYQKTDGAVVAGPFTLSDLGGSEGCNTGLGDPIVLYDHLANRWMLAEFAAQGNVLCVYISKTDDPLGGGWFNYHFPTPHFPDYPHYGVWPDAYYVTSNEQDGPAAYALDRAKMLAGQPATMQRFVAVPLAGFGFQALTPCDLNGPPPPAGSPHYLLRHRDDEVHNPGAADPDHDFLDLYTFHVDWTTPGNSTLSGPVGIPISEFDSELAGLTSMSCFPQKGSTIRLDPVREVVMNRLQYRNFGNYETLVGSFVTDVDGHDHGGVRWFELRKSGAEAWHVHQEGTYAPDAENRWMSSVAMDSKGNIALVYNVSSTTTFPGLRYVGRLASDPMGTMPRGELVLTAGSAANSSNRYGDYAALSVDADDVFWFTGMYNKTGQWSTRVASFKFK
jgi:hypothetical protein